MTDRVPAEVFAPGEYLKDALDELGWTQSEFAEIIGKPIALVNQIIHAKRSITPETAKAIGAALNTSAEFWMNLDAGYQLHRTEPPPQRIRVEAGLRTRYPVKDMLGRGWILPSDNAEVLRSRVFSFFNVQSLEEKPQLPHAARKGAQPTNYSDLSPVQVAWLFRVKQIAETMPVTAYSEKRLRDSLRNLRNLMAEPEEARHVPRILEECGVRFVIAEPFPSSMIDGVCFWLDGQDQSPVIGMSLRLDRIDNFWFVLRHEIEHVLRRDAYFDDEIRPSNPQKEANDEAAVNRVASDFCVPSEELEDFMQRMDPLYSARRVQAFASLLDIHPGIVVGQIQYKTGRWNLLRRYLVKIREFLTPNAVTDGYGQTLQIG